MKIYNSLTKRKEEFIPLQGNDVKMYACGITVSVMLGGEYSCACTGAVNYQDVYKHKLIHYGNAAHSFRSESADHYIVKQADQICNSVLNHYRNGDRGEHFIKISVAEIIFQLKLLYISQESPISWS